MFAAWSMVVNHYDSQIIQSQIALLNFAFVVGGLEHFLFSPILGINIPTDFHIFQRGSNHQPVLLLYIVHTTPENTIWSIEGTN